MQGRGHRARVIQPEQARHTPETSTHRSTVGGSELRGDETPSGAAGTLLLVGNPNVGKSVLFKALTRRYVTVSNFPGTTVEIVKAQAKLRDREVTVVDTPGINDLHGRSGDTAVTRQMIQGSPGATIVQVADAKNLRRALLLTLQLADLGHPMLLVLNMCDELEQLGARIDVARLSAILGIPVVKTIAVRGIGTEELVAAIAAARLPRIGHSIEGAAGTSTYAHSCERLEHVNGILGQTYTLERPAHPSFAVRLGFWTMDPVRGLGVLAIVLFVVFWFVGRFGAGTLSELLEVAVFHQRLTPAAIRTIDTVLPFPHQHEIETVPYSFSIPLVLSDIPIAEANRDVIGSKYIITSTAPPTTMQRAARLLHDFLVGEFGVITMALSYAFAIVFPIVTTFFLVFGLLEDSGYFSRMAIMVNRSFSAIGLNGKAVLPMVLGLGCDTMATMTTRILDTRRERLITTVLLALAVPCSAQLGVLLALTAKVSPSAVVVWIAIVLGVMLLVGRLSAMLFPGERSEFILEIPPLRRPLFNNVMAKTFARLRWYLKEVIPLFILATAALFVLDRLQLLDAISRIGEPLVTGWLGLPREMANAFLVGFLRRDFGAVYILDAATGPNPTLNSEQILVAMITITLFVPCIANLLVIAKEHGVKTAFAMAAFIFPFAFLVGGLVHHARAWLPT